MLPYIIKKCVLSLLGWPLKTGFTVCSELWWGLEAVNYTGLMQYFVFLRVAVLHWLYCTSILILFLGGLISCALERFNAQMH